ncbi:hypothetical protein QBC37DRAFT_49328 [Rhypophila decipiens]|uniref:Uncharacterized protein n=1 Tax=Rhypophila decipiens TaxID=261697 RepID=A0AAN6XZT5_9PEZI|nr:hypothetical protein QBC37DRAFT_49328 [Rhypophila decipiens]
MKSITLSNLLFTTLTLANPIQFTNPLTPRQVNAPARITSATISGTGCQPNTYTTQFSPSGDAFTLGLDSYQTFFGPGTSTSDRTRQCDLVLTLNYPPGCSLLTLSTTYHGFAQLETSVSGQFTSSYALSPGALSGDGSAPGSITVGSGAFGGNGNVYTKVDDPINARVSFAGSNRRDGTFTVKTRLSLTGSTGRSGTLTQDDVSVSIASQSRC